MSASNGADDSSNKEHPHPDSHPQTHPQREIFRKTSLERLSNPEQLDNLLMVVTPRAWATLACLLSLAALVILWAIFSTIPIKVQGRGIVKNPQGLLYYVPANLGGFVHAIHVKHGQSVNEGDLIAEIEDLQEELKRKNIYTKLGLLHDELSELKEKLATNNSSELKESFDDIKDQIKNKEHEIEILMNDKIIIELREPYYRVQSRYSGTILEILASVGDRVDAGSPLVWMETITDDKSPYLFYGYFPVENGKRIAEGMKVQIELSTVDSQEYGYLIGQVKEVSGYAVSEESIENSIHNKALADFLTTGSQAVIQVIVDVATDPKSGEYIWTSGKTPPGKITTGTVNTMQVIVQRVRPIYYVLPIGEFKLSGEQ